MNRFRLLNLLALLLAGAIPAAAQTWPRETPASLSPEEMRDLPFLSSGIVTVVNNEVITSHELARKMGVELYALKRSAASNEQYLSKAHELYLKMLKEEVEERVLLGAAVDEGIVMTDDDVQVQAKREIQRVGSREKLEETLRQAGRTYEEWIEGLRKELITKELILRKIGFKRGAKADKEMPLDSIPAPDELRRYYEEHREDFHREEQVKTGRIILTFDDRTRAFTRSLVESLRRQLEAGADFGMLARFYSEDKLHAKGEWPYAPRSSFPAKIRDDVFALTPGRLSDPLEAENLVCLVRMDGRIEAFQKPFEDQEVQNEINEIVQNRLVLENVEKVRRLFLRKALIRCRDAEVQSIIDQARAQESPQ